MTSEIQQLIHQRRGESDKHRRRDISKLIRKKMRQAIRKYKDVAMDQILSEFQELTRLDQVGIQKKIADKHTELGDDDFACMLKDIYADSNFDPAIITNNTAISSAIPAFKLHELEQVLSKMKARKSPDKHGIVMEIIKYRSNNLKRHILLFFNEFLHHDFIEQS